MKRYGQVIGLKPEHLEMYKAYHAKVWPEVLETIRRCHIHNYSIFHRQGLLFAYYEYHGTDFAADMARMAADPKTQEWWAIMNPIQSPLPDRKDGAWWTDLEEVFHTD